MNLRQKSYDSFDKTNKLLKLTNSYYHNRNLELIRNRKSQYKQPDKIMIKRNYMEPFMDYYVKKENIDIRAKINGIRWKEIKPQINEYFLKKEGKIQDFRNQHKKIADKLRENENKNYKKRIEEQKAFLSTKEMDKEYEEIHARTIKKLRKLGANENIVLPPIRDGKKNPILEETRKHYQTEGSKKGGSSSSKEDSRESSDKEDSDKEDKEEESKE